MDAAAPLPELQERPALRLLAVLLRQRQPGNAAAVVRAAPVEGPLLQSI